MVTEVAHALVRVATLQKARSRGGSQASERVPDAARTCVRHVEMTRARLAAAEFAEAARGFVNASPAPFHFARSDLDPFCFAL